jgi:hypothetical protein
MGSNTVTGVSVQARVVALLPGWEGADDSSVIFPNSQRRVGYL